MGLERENAWLIAGVLAVGVGVLSGFWYGKSSEAETWQRLLYRAELPVSCEQRITEAAEMLKFEASERAR